VGPGSRAGACGACGSQLPGGLSSRRAPLVRPGHRPRAAPRSGAARLRRALARILRPRPAPGAAAPPGGSRPPGRDRRDHRRRRHRDPVGARGRRGRRRRRPHLGVGGTGQGRGADVGRTGLQRAPDPGSPSRRRGARVVPVPAGQPRRRTGGPAAGGARRRDADVGRHRRPRGRRSPRRHPRRRRAPPARATRPLGVPHGPVGWRSNALRVAVQRRDHVGHDRDRLGCGLRRRRAAGSQGRGRRWRAACALPHALSRLSRRAPSHGRRPRRSRRLVPHRRRRRGRRREGPRERADRHRHHHRRREGLARGPRSGARGPTPPTRRCGHRRARPGVGRARRGPGR